MTDRRRLDKMTLSGVGALAEFHAPLVLAMAVVLIVGWLVLVPLWFLVSASFLPPGSSTFTLGNYARVLAGDTSWNILFNSVAFAAGSAATALVLGTVLAWLYTRTDASFKTVLYALSFIPLVVPGMLLAVAWSLLAAPRTGVFNVIVQSFLGAQGPLFNVYSLGGMVWVEGLHNAPIGFLLMTAALRSTDPALEESATMSGASPWQVARMITLKLGWPSLTSSFLILFVAGMESFEVPAVLGLPAGVHVLTASVYRAIHRYPSEIGLASAYSMALLVICSGALLCQARLALRATRFVSVTGKGFRPRPIPLGRWRPVVAAAAVLYASLAVLLPVSVLLWLSLHKYYGGPSTLSLQRFSFDAFRSVFAFPGIGRTVQTSVVLSLATATAVVLISSVTSWIVLRTRTPGRWILDYLASLPMTIPGIVLGLAVMIAYLNLPMGIYGTIGILFVAYVTRFLPYGMRAVATSIRQLHPDLEDSAAMSGASWPARLRRIILPLVAPGLFAGWVYVAIVTLRELSASVLLYSPKSEVLSVVIWELWQNGQLAPLAALGVMMITALCAVALPAAILIRRSHSEARQSQRTAKVPDLYHQIAAPPA